MSSQEGQNKGVVGSPMDRIDGRLKVTGAAKFAAEFGAPGLCYAVLVQSEVPAGRVKSLNAREAEHAPGVIAVITPPNMPPMPKPTVPPSGTAAPLLAVEVEYSGQNIAVVIAETIEQATAAAELIKPEYETKRATTELAASLDSSFVPKTGREPVSTRGRFDAAFDRSSTKNHQVYSTPTEHHNPMEPHATVAVWSGDTLTAYDATQAVGNAALNIAEMMNLPPKSVRVVNPFVGGGFGCKGQSWLHAPIAAMCARIVKRPVKLVLTRKQMFTSNGHRPETRQELAFGTNSQGALQAISHKVHCHTSQMDEFLEPSGHQSSLLYACENVDVEHRLVRLNVPAATYQRAPGESSGSFALETMMDELAVELKMDPVEFRLRNFAEKDGSTGNDWSSNSLKECYQVGADAFGWSRRNSVPGSMREGGVLVGYGMAQSAYPANFRPSSAKAAMTSDGRVLITCGTQDLGTGTYTILTQIAADALGVEPEMVRVEIGDSSLPSSPGSGGSCTATSAGSAVQAAGQALRGHVIGFAQSDPSSPLHDVPNGELVVSRGVVSSKTDPAKKLSYAQILQACGKKYVEQDASVQPGIERMATAGPGQNPASSGKQGQAHTMYGFGAQFCEVHVDPDLRTIRVARWTSAHAVGKILNRKTLESQIRGGIVWGIGMGLLEETLLDLNHGRFVNSNLAEYHVPVNADVPHIDVHIVEEKDTLVSPLGAKGAGEIGICGAAAAIANAVYNATGKRVRDLPITLDKIL